MLARLQDINQTAGTVNAINPTPMSWNELEEASVTDPSITSLRALIRTGIPADRSQWPAEHLEYFGYHDHLSTAGLLVLYKDRTVVPQNLRKGILEVLRLAHQHD